MTWQVEQAKVPSQAPNPSRSMSLLMATSRRLSPSFALNWEILYHESFRSQASNLSLSPGQCAFPQTPQPHRWLCKNCCLLKLEMKRFLSNLNNGCRQKISKEWGQEIVWISFLETKDKPRLNPKVGTNGFMFKAHILGREKLQVAWLARSPVVTTLNPTRAVIFQRQGTLSEGLVTILKVYISSDYLFWNTVRAGSGSALDEVTWWPENRFPISKCKFFLTALAEN